MIIFYHLKNFFRQICKRNLQILATEMYEILYGLSPHIMQDTLETKSNYYNTCNVPAFSSRNTKTVRYGLQTISYMAPKNWDLAPEEIKQVTTLHELKLQNCPF